MILANGEKEEYKDNIDNGGKNENTRKYKQPVHGEEVMRPRKMRES